jgi:cell wall-associated NlpC family hydrolase
MACSLAPARRRFLTGRRTVVSLVAACGLTLVPFPASAEPQPATSREAAGLIAARAHDLEVLTEQFNEARERLRATRAAATRAAAELVAARSDLARARDRVRTVARSAYTGDRLGSLQAMLTSDSPDELLDRVGTLQAIADHNSGVLGSAAQATQDADRARAAAQEVARRAQVQVDRVAAQQDDLDRQIAVYQVQYDRLHAAEVRASRAAAERRAVQRAAAARAVAARRAANEPAPSTRRPSASKPATRPVTATPAPPPPVRGGSGAAGTAVRTAMAQLGDPYVWAAAGPDAFDCSGLVQYAYGAAGIALPHSSRMQSTMGTSVSRSALRPGDLVFFFSPVSHVGIYIGNGQMVHAATSGSPVKIASIDAMGSYHNARRIAG